MDYAQRTAWGRATPSGPLVAPSLPAPSVSVRRLVA